MTALLVKNGIQPPYTHDLVYLYSKLQPFCTNLDVAIDEVDYLSVSAVEFRYPGGNATNEDVDICVETCTKIRFSLLMFFQELPE